MSCGASHAQCPRWFTNRKTLLSALLTVRGLSEAELIGLIATYFWQRLCMQERIVWAFGGGGKSRCIPMARRAGTAVPHGNRGDERVGKPLIDPRRDVKSPHVAGMELKPRRACNLAPGGRGQLVRGNQHSQAIAWRPKFQESCRLAPKCYQATSSESVLRTIICSYTIIGHPKLERDSLREPCGNHIRRARFHIERPTDAGYTMFGDRCLDKTHSS